MGEEYLTATEAWLSMTRELLERGQKSSPRGMDTVELLGYQSVIDMRRPVVEFPERKLGKSFLPGEAWWILTGRNDVASIRKYTKAIEQFSDNGIDFFGAYGPKIYDQLGYIIRTLESDPQSRQAVIDIWRPNPPRTKDVPCTLSAQFLIRNKQIHCNMTMRSSDAWLGWPYDVFNFSMLSLYIALMLNAKGIYQANNYRAYDIMSLGQLRLTAGSQHFYLRNLSPEVEQMLHGFPNPPRIHVDLPDYKCVNHQSLILDLKSHADRHGDHKSWLSPYYE